MDDNNTNCIRKPIVYTYILLLLLLLVRNNKYDYIYIYEMSQVLNEMEKQI